MGNNFKEILSEINGMLKILLHTLVFPEIATQVQGMYSSTEMTTFIH